MPKRLERSSGSPRKRYNFELCGQRLCLGPRTRLMGVLNITPDSFSDGGLFLDPGRAQERALRMEAEGADIIDVGAESTRPGARAVSAVEELRRLRPVLRRLAKRCKVPISVDTMKAAVADAALGEGAKIINDVSALKDTRMAGIVARYRAGVILMHMRGEPRTMQKDLPHGSVVAQVKSHLTRAAGRALEAGIPRQSIVIDPGFGFGKSAAQNVEMLTRINEFAGLGFPVLAGLSRKSFIGQLCEAPVDGRLPGSLAAALIAAMRGAHILRVHDVLTHAQAFRIIDEVAWNN